MRLIRSTRSCVRLSSTLAENLEKAAQLGNRGRVIKTPEYNRNDKVEGKQEKNEGEEFREMFLMPKRKLQMQLRIEQMTGRGEDNKKSQRDIMDRLAVKVPRREEMPVDQDWPSVWPAAATFRSSVVPLPVRMGSRKKPENRPPFKTYGNLELLKIPNFLHLTPEHIRRHCEAIKQFCTPFPKELKNDPKLINKHLPLTFSYSDFVHQGTSIRDIRARIVTMKINVATLSLTPHALDKLRRLAGNRYDEKMNTLTIVSDRCFTRKQNREYVEYLITVLYHESNKVEKWEKEQQRADDWKVKFEGSETQNRLTKLIPNEASPDKVENVELNNSDVKEFIDVWTEYRNTTETPESTRRYANAVRKLYSIPGINTEANN